MRTRHWSRTFALAATCIVGLLPVASAAADTRVQAQVRIGRESDWRGGVSRDVYERGYREGHLLGEDHARRDRAYDFERESVFRRGDVGYNRRFGSRDQYRVEFRRGFSDGYRAGYDRWRPRVVRRIEVRGQRGPAAYYEPAFGRGYEDGYEAGLRDAQDHDRYDPVGARDYRDGDKGYSRSYGARDAYKNNYRAGFRQGYEEGYRDAGR